MIFDKIGELITYERVKQDISLESLSYGVCSTSLLKKIEVGERETDFFVLERYIYWN